MMRKLIKLLRNDRGAGITEFALLAPALIGMIITVGQFGILYFAQSGLKSAVAEGARYASVYPRPSNAEILAKIDSSRFGLQAANIKSTTVVDCEEDGRECVDITMSYSVPMDLVPISWPSTLLTETRRVFVAELPTSGAGGSGGSGGGGGKGGGKDKDDEDDGTGGGTEDPDCKGKKCETDEPDPDQPSEPTPDEPTPGEPTDPEPEEPTDPEPEEPCKNGKKCETDPEPTDPEPTEPEPTDPTPSEPEPSEPDPVDPDEPGCGKNKCK